MRDVANVQSTSGVASKKESLERLQQQLSQYEQDKKDNPSRAKELDRYIRNLKAVINAIKRQ